MADLRSQVERLKAEGEYRERRHQEELDEQWQQMRSEADQRVRQIEDELAAKLIRLRSELAAAEAQAEIVIQNDVEIRKVLLTAITSKSKGGTYNGSNASSVKEAIEKVLPLLTTDS